MKWYISRCFAPAIHLLNEYNCILMVLNNDFTAQRPQQIKKSDCWWYFVTFKIKVLKYFDARYIILSIQIVLENAISIFRISENLKIIYSVRICELIYHNLMQGSYNHNLHFCFQLGIFTALIYSHRACTYIVYPCIYSV